MLFLLACEAGSVEIGKDTGVGHDSADSGGGDTDTAQTTDSGDTADTEDSGTTAPVAFSDLVARIHPQMGSIIELDWTQTGRATVRANYHVGAEPDLSTPSFTVEAGPHRLLLLGAPFDTEVAWQLLADDAAVAPEDTIRTDPPPRGMPDVDTVEGDETAWDPSMKWLLFSIAPSSGPDSPDNAWTLIVDRQGRTVWANESPTGRTTFMPMVSVDGADILIDYNSWWGSFDGGDNSQVARLDIEDNELERFDTPGMIHPFTQTGDGAIVWGASLGSSYSGERLDILDPGGSPRTLWDCNTWARAHGEGACGSNALDWDPDTGNILFSLYSAETVMELTLDGEEVRWFGHAQDAWGWAPGSQDFFWQHGAHYLPDGHLLVSSRIDDHTEETVAVEYEIDESNQTLHEVWSFGQGEGVWAYIMGEARRLDGGNTLHNYGYDPRVREATPDDEVVWDLAYDEDGTMGRMTALSDLYPFWHATP